MKFYKIHFSCLLLLFVFATNYAQQLPPIVKYSKDIYDIMTSLCFFPPAFFKFKQVLLDVCYFSNISQPKKKSPLKTVYKSKSRAAKDEVTKSKQRKIDDILDKISKSGYESLSQEEKDFLFRAGKK